MLFLKKTCRQQAVHSLLLYTHTYLESPIYLNMHKATLLFTSLSCCSVCQYFLGRPLDFNLRNNTVDVRGAKKNLLFCSVSSPPTHCIVPGDEEMLWKKWRWWREVGEMVALALSSCLAVRRQVRVCFLSHLDNRKRAADTTFLLSLSVSVWPSCHLCGSVVWCRVVRGLLVL